MFNYKHDYVSIKGNTYGNLDYTMFNYKRGYSWEIK